MHDPATRSTFIMKITCARMPTRPEYGALAPISNPLTMDLYLNLLSAREGELVLYALGFELTGLLGLLGLNDY